MGVFNRTREACDRVTFANVDRAKARASKLSTPDLVTWAETVSMNQGYQISVGVRNGDETAIHEALVMNESLHGILMELAERSTH